MVRFSHDELPESGTSGDWFKDTAAKARDALCDVHADYPAVTTGIDGSLPGSAGSVRKAIMDSICRRSPATPPPEPDALFAGGQCATKYRMIFEVRSTSDVFGEFIQPYGVNVWGNISGVSIGRDTVANKEVLQVRCHGLASSPYNPELVKLNLVSSFFEKFSGVTLQQVYTLDGDADICGNPNPQYPPDYSRDLPIPYPVPPAPAPSPNFPPLPIFLPIGAYFSPRFDINIDVGGINFSFDAGGVEFNLGNRDGCDGSQGSCSAPPSGSFPDDYANKDDIAGVNDNIDQAKDFAERAKDAAEGAKKVADDAANNDGDHPANDPNKQDKTERSEDDPKEEAGIERLLGVQVFLTEFQKNIRTQDGGSAPDVRYAGWFQFSTKGLPHPRNYIHFEENYFIAPVGADGFSYTVYEGIRARHTVVTAKVSPGN